MPVKDCQINGRPGKKWGDSGTCYPYTKGNTQSERAAYDKAARQGRAVSLSKARAAGHKVPAKPKG